MKKHWKAIVGVLLIFIFGFISGILGTSIVVHHRVMMALKHGPEAIVSALERRMTRNLSLDTTQKGQVHDILMANLKQRQALEDQIRPQVQNLNQETVAQIEAVLKPDQKDRFEQMVTKLQATFGAKAPVAATPPAK